VKVNRRWQATQRQAPPSRRATGAGGNSNLTVRGSDITANGDVHLQADGNVNLLAAQNTVEMQRKSSSSSTGAGVAVTLGENGIAFGVTANASRGKGKGEGSDVTWSNTHVSAGEQLTIASGADTTLRGAVASGQQVAMDMGVNLNLESLQDTSVFHSKDTSVGGSVTVGYGVAASGSVGQQKIDSDYASVIEQTSIQAGDGGFQIKVNGNTDLKGAAIASTQQAVESNANTLTTGTLTTTDIENHAHYQASSVSVGGGFSVAGDAQPKQDSSGAHWMTMQDGASAAPPIALSASANSHSTTASGISGAQIHITDAEAQQALTGQNAETTLASLNRDVITGQLNSNALDTIFNEQEIRAGFEIGSAFAQQVGTFLNNRAQESAATQEALDHELNKPLSERDPARIAQLQQQLEDNAAWVPGGTYRQILTALSAAAGANVTGTSAQFAQNALINYVQQQGAAAIGDMVKQGELAEGSALHAGLHAIVACAGAAAANQGCTDGALGAAASSVLTNLFADNPNETATQKEAKRNVIASIVAGVAATGGWEGATATGAVIAAIDNNYLTQKEIKYLQKEMDACSDDECRSAVQDKAALLSKINDDDLRVVCMDSPSAAECKNRILDATQYVNLDKRDHFLETDVGRSGIFLFDHLFENDQGHEYYGDLKDRETFFQAFQNSLSRQGHEVVWPQTAADVSSTLGLIDYCPALMCGNAAEWIDDVGKFIMNTEWPVFQSLWFGDVLRGQEAKTWDEQTLMKEQHSTQPFYDFLDNSGGRGWFFVILGGKINMKGSIFSESDRIRHGLKELEKIRETKINNPTQEK